MASIAKYLRACSVTQSCLTLWTVARQAPLSMGLLREEYWSGLPFPPPQDLPDPGIEPRSPAGQVDSLLLSHWESPIIREMQVKTPVSRHLTLVRRPSSKGVQIINAGEDVEEKEPPHPLVVMRTGTSTLEKTMEVS